MSKTLMALSAAVAVLAILVAGCGGGSDSSSTEASTSSLTKAEFVKEGNAICAKGSKEINEGFEQFVEENGLSKKKAPPKAVQEEAVETVLIPRIRKEVESIRALGPPDEEAEAVLDAAEAALEKGEEEPIQFLKEESEGPFAKANKLSREYGLVKCGEEEGEEG
ncbi:MAG TPA: hypothetical protein VFN85_07715 [Solirubrobacterales bacterium]|nr:hypothetical protein [Solirubrobacterales bacterium]